MDGWVCVMKRYAKGSKGWRSVELLSSSGKARLLWSCSGLSGVIACCYIILGNSRGKLFVCTVEQVCLVDVWQWWW